MRAREAWEHGEGGGLAYRALLLLRVCVVGFSVWGRGRSRGLIRGERARRVRGCWVWGSGGEGRGRMADVRQERADALEGLGVDAGGDGW